ncbi:MAG TPA: sulfurtransferase TusA family protein [Candidatus Kryptonia bacterium]
MDIKVDATLDCTGLACPIPVIKTKKALDELERGKILKMIATDPGSVKDISAWARKTGQQLVGQEESDRRYIFYILKIK